MTTTRSLQQSIQLEMRYAVHFTDGLFSETNELLVELLRDSRGPANVMFVVDSEAIIPDTDRPPRVTHE